MTVPYTFANASGLVPASELDVNFAYVSNNVSTANTVVSNAQPNITSVGTLTNLSVAGNVIAARLKGEGGKISNIQGANISGAVANATYAVTANSASYATYAFSSNSTQANVANVANLVTGGNVSGQVANALIAGTVYTNAQPNITSVGTLTSLSSSGNVTGGNILTGGQVSATSNVTGGNILTGGQVSAVGNVRGSNFNTVGLITATGNVTAGNILTGGEVSAVGDITGNNLSVTTIVGTLTTAVQPNIISVGVLSNLRVAGNITANNISANITFHLPVYANTTVRDAAISSPAIGMLVVVGNIYQGYNGSFWGNITLT
jgi:hypothetical protein